LNYPNHGRSIFLSRQIRFNLFRQTTSVKNFFLNAQLQKKNISRLKEKLDCHWRWRYCDIFDVSVIFSTFFRHFSTFLKTDVDFQFLIRLVDLYKKGKLLYSDKCTNLMWNRCMNFEVKIRYQSLIPFRCFWHFRCFLLLAFWSFFDVFSVLRYFHHFDGIQHFV